MKTMSYTTDARRISDLTRSGMLRTVYSAPRQGMAESRCIPVASDDDLVAARCKGRTIAEQMGFPVGEATLVATAIYELARNILNYAGSGEIAVFRTGSGDRIGVTVIARDQGPGIPDTKLALQEGYSTAGGLGLGLPGVRRIMDELQVRSAPGCGTTITATKWKR